MDDGLVRFLLARISDDERQHRRQPPGDAHDVQSPARALAECAVKRETVGIMQRILVLRDLPQERQVRDAAAEVLRRMAVIYEDHNTYRAEWRPKSRLTLT
jgi:hypothetical protein